jgi:hypothetical protein
VLSDVIEHVLDGPILLDGDVVRCHQASDRAGFIPEQLDRFGAFFIREKRQELFGDVGRQFAEEERSIRFAWWRRPTRWSSRRHRWDAARQD